MPTFNMDIYIYIFIYLFIYFYNTDETTVKRFKSWDFSRESIVLENFCSFRDTKSTKFVAEKPVTIKVCTKFLNFSFIGFYFSIHSK